MRVLKTILAGVLGGALALGAVAQASPNEEKPLKSVSLLLPWTMAGSYSPFALALVNGYYREVGIDLAINQGNGSLVTSQSVANGTTEFGYADTSVAAQLVGKGAGLKSVGVFQRKSALMIAYREPRVIDTIESLKGATIIHGANDNATQAFNSLLAKNNMSWDDMNSVIVAPTAFAQSFLSDPEALLLGSAYSTFPSIQAREPDVKQKYFADFGINVMGAAVLVSDKTIAEDPQLVRDFLSATIRGFEEATEDPEAAVEAAAELFPAVVGPKKDITLLELEAGLALLHTPETEGKPLGWTTDAQWEEMIAYLRDSAGGLDADLPVSAFYTNEFLPQE